MTAVGLFPWWLELGGCRYRLPWLLVVAISRVAKYMASCSFDMGIWIGSRC